MRVSSFRRLVKLWTPSTMLAANRTTGTIRRASRRTVQIAAAHPPMARESALQPPDSRKRSDGDDNAPSNDGNEGGQYQETHGSKQSNQAT